MIPLFLYITNTSYQFCKNYRLKGFMCVAISFTYSMSNGSILTSKQIYARIYIISTELKEHGFMTT